MTADITKNVYETKEAHGILMRVCSELSTTVKRQADAELASAADHLLQEAKDLLSKIGFQLTKNENGVDVATLPQAGAVSLRNDGGKILVRAVHGIQGGESKQKPAEIDFDPVTGRFEGHANDEHVVPVPGKPPCKRNALAVVADLVATCMRDSAKQ